MGKKKSCMSDGGMVAEAPMPKKKGKKVAKAPPMMADPMMSKKPKMLKKGGKSGR